MRYEEEVDWILRALERKGVTEFSFTNEDGEKWEGIEDCAYQVCNHEEGWVIYYDPTLNNRRRGVFFVAGNSLGEIVCDYSIPRNIELPDAMDIMWQVCQEYQIWLESEDLV